MTKAPVGLFADDLIFSGEFNALASPPESVVADWPSLI